MATPDDTTTTTTQDAAAETSTGTGHSTEGDENAVAETTVEEAPETPPNPAPAEASAPRRAQAVRDLPRLASRVLGMPLMIAPAKLEAILAVLGPRLGLAPGGELATKLGAFFDDDEDDGAPAKPYETTDDGIALVAIDGTLVYKTSWLGALSGLTGYNDIGAAVAQAVADPQVKGILLEVDSYGGECSGSFDLADAIFAARQAKPIYAVAADDSLSAAYLLAAAAERVFVSRTSGAGSIGVVGLHVDESAADKMDGLKYTYVHAGARKVDGNPHEPLSAPARAALQAECDRLQALFAGSVARYRGLSADDILAQEASVYHGEAALTARLADAIGTPGDALAALRAEIARRGAVSSSAGAALSLAAESPALLTRGETVVLAAAVTPASNVVDLAALREAATGDATKLAVEIVELCRLAGQPQLAGEMIAARLSTDAVRQRLQDVRASASEARVTSGAILSDAGLDNAQAASAGWVKAFAPYSGAARK